MLEANHPRSLAGNLPSLEVEGVAVGFVGGFAEIVGDVSSAILEIAKLPVVRNIAPDQVLSLRIPGRPFGPQAAGIESFDGGVANLCLEAFGIDHDDIRIRIALGCGVGPKVAMKGPSLVSHLSSAVFFGHAHSGRGEASRRVTRFRSSYHLAAPSLRTSESK